MGLTANRVAQYVAASGPTSGNKWSKMMTDMSYSFVVMHREHGGRAQGVPAKCIAVTPTIARASCPAASAPAEGRVRVAETGHTGLMSDDEQWYFRISDKAVVQGKDAGALDRMGPYPDRETAERALEIAAERNKSADDADREWS